MEKIPTAEDFFAEHCVEMDSTVAKQMIEFAKLHVEAALKEASERYEYDEIHISDNPEFLKDSILNSYPLENIK
jgi:hypothetical protein